jgi:hypothetical protein
MKRWEMRLRAAKNRQRMRDYRDRRAAARGMAYCHRCDRMSSVDEGVCHRCGRVLPLFVEDDDVEENPRELGPADLAKADFSKLAYGDEEEGAFVTPVKNPAVRRNRGATGRCETFHGDGACGDVTEKKLWMPGPIVLVGACLDCGYNVTNRRSEKDGRYVHDHKAGVKLYRRADGNERPSKTLSPPRQVFVLGNWLGCTYDDGSGKQELTGSSRIKACTDNGKRLFAIHSTKGCLYVISGGSFRIRDWMYD